MKAETATRQVTYELLEANDAEQALRRFLAAVGELEPAATPPRTVVSSDEIGESVRDTNTPIANHFP